MKISYTYTVLRYVHDVVTGEFVNLGVILSAPAAGFLGCSVTSSVSRTKKFFGSVDSDYLRDLLRHVERSVNRMSRDILASPLLSNDKDDALTYAERVIPRDDSALQLSPVGGGISDDPQRALGRLFDRYVNRYRAASPKNTRLDQEVLSVFRRPLEELNLVAHVQPKLIESPDYQHEFPLAWKNGVWNTCDAVSFDLSEPGDIIEKANKWMGRAINLSESPEPFRLILLLGEPRKPELNKVVATAEHIIKKAQSMLEIVTVREREAQKLAEMVAHDVTR
ncbi:MAG: DUF3037 domain-containing protein [Thermoanaerobaculia bacterium]